MACINSITKPERSQLQILPLQLSLYKLDEGRPKVRLLLLLLSEGPFGANREEGRFISQIPANPLQCLRLYQRPYAHQSVPDHTSSSHPYIF